MIRVCEKSPNGHLYLPLLKFNISIREMGSILHTSSYVKDLEWNVVPFSTLVFTDRIMYPCSLLKSSNQTFQICNLIITKAWIIKQVLGIKDLLGHKFLHPFFQLNRYNPECELSRNSYWHWALCFDHVLKMCHLNCPRNAVRLLPPSEV